VTQRPITTGGPVDGPRFDVDEILAAAEAEDAADLEHHRGHRRTIVDDTIAAYRAFEIGVWEMAHDNPARALRWLKYAVRSDVEEAEALLRICATTFRAENGAAQESTAAAGEAGDATQPLRLQMRDEEEPAKDVDAGIAALWQRFADSPDQASRDRLVLHYAPLVKYVAGRVGTGLPTHVDVGDLVQSGIFGLVDAIEKFDPERGLRFETYAMQRIRGAILDDLRSQDWVPRAVRSKVKEAERAMERLGARLNRTPTDAELAAELGIGLDDLRDFYGQLQLTSVVALEDLVAAGRDSGSLVDTLPDDDAVDPVAVLVDQDNRRQLAQAIAQLTERDKLVLSLYYFENLSFAEIGKVLGVIPRRVGQLHTRAVHRLRAILLRPNPQQDDPIDPSADEPGGTSSAPQPALIRDVVESAAAGNREQVAGLVRELLPIVRRYCRTRLRHLSRGSDVEDCVQEILLVALGALPGYRNEPASFLPFVLRIAAQKLADLRRVNFHRLHTERAAIFADAGEQRPSSAGSGQERATSGDGVEQSVPEHGMVQLLARAFAS